MRLTKNAKLIFFILLFILGILITIYGALAIPQPSHYYNCEQTVYDGQNFSALHDIADTLDLPVKGNLSRAPGFHANSCHYLSGILPNITSETYLGSSFTMCGWVNVPDKDMSYPIFSVHNSTDTLSVVIQDSLINVNTQTGALPPGIDISTKNLSNVTFHLCFAYNSTDGRIFFNGTNAMNFTYHINYTGFSIMTTSSVIITQFMSMDEISIYDDYYMNDSSTLYNNGQGIFFIPQLSQASLDNICTNNIDSGVTCQIVTPVITCGLYDYTIYNISHDTIITGNLSLFTDNIYYFNFSMPDGTYYIRICDNSTRTVLVGGNMIGLTINTWVHVLILILIFSSFYLGWAGAKWYRMFIALSGILMILYDYFWYSSIVPLSTGSAKYLAIVLITVFFIIGLVLVYVGFMSAVAESKTEISRR